MRLRASIKRSRTRCTLSVARRRFWLSKNVGGMLFGAVWCLAHRHTHNADAMPIPISRYRARAAPRCVQGCARRRRHRGRGPPSPCRRQARTDQADDDDGTAPWFRSSPCLSSVCYAGVGLSLSGSLALYRSCPVPSFVSRLVGRLLTYAPGGGWGARGRAECCWHAASAPRNRCDAQGASLWAASASVTAFASPSVVGTASAAVAAFASASVAGTASVAAFASASVAGTASASVAVDRTASAAVTASESASLWAASASVAVGRRLCVRLTAS
jgi:hypothetical protein